MTNMLKKSLLIGLVMSCIVTTVAVLPLPVASAEEAVAKQELPNVVILATGGTIASTASSATDTSNYQVSTGVEALIDAVPEMKEIANVTGEQVFNTGSPNMTDEHRLTLVKRINELLATDEVDGIVVTHGTDTLESTAYFLNLTVKSDKPVVVVGAMRPASAISADGPMNLYNAVKVAGTPAAKDKGVLIVMNDRIGAARFIAKTNYWATDTFKGIEQGFLGDIVAGKVRFYQESLLKHTHESVFDVTNLTELPKVDIIYGSYSNTDPSMAEAALKAGAQGLVFAGSETGELAEVRSEIAARGYSDADQNQLEYLAKLVRTGGGDAQWAKAEMERLAGERGAVVVSSFYQASGQSLYFSDDEIESNSLNPHKSKILLQLALTKTTDLEQIQQYFDEY